MVCRRPVSTFFHIIPARPGLFLYVIPEFLKRGKFLQQFSPEMAPQKIVSAYFPTDYFTAPGSPPLLSFVKEILL